MLISMIVSLALGIGSNLYLVHFPTWWPAKMLPNDFNAGPHPWGEGWPQEFLEYEIPKICRCSFIHEWFGVVDIYTVGVQTPDQPELEYESASWTLHQMEQVVRGKPFVVHTHRIEGTYSNGIVVDEAETTRYHATGLILNPIVYALPVWLVVVGIYLAIRTRLRSTRRRKGLCEHCAYNTQGLAKCPECGAESSSAATIQA